MIHGPSPVRFPDGWREKALDAARGFVAVAFLLVLSSLARAMPAPGDADPVDPTVASNTGAATYRIPIDVPPGPGGLAPQLALVYSSHAGDGPFGVGWRLQLGEIRCTTKQRGVPNFAACPPPSADPSIRYELDGQLLTYNPTEGRYHSFVESFREIKFVSATAGWVANSPDGTILRYGSTADSRVAGGGPTARWLLSEIEDPFENKVTITYASAPETVPSGPAEDPGTAYPADVTYASGDRAIHFVYEPRPDPLHDFAGGIERTITRRLKEIQVKSYVTELVHKWTFGYDGLTGASYTTARSRLGWAQLVGSDGTSTVPRQEFRYTDHGLTGNQWGSDDPSWHLGSTDVQLADVDGDGLPDKVRGFYLGWVSSNPPLLGPVGAGSVELNTGTGWAPNAVWTDMLEATCCSVARLRATLAYPDAAEQLSQESLGVVEDSASVDVDPAGGVLAYDELAAFPGRVFVTPDAGDGFVGEVSVSGWGFRAADLNADGLADLVYSFYLSGITENVNATGAALPDPEYIPGRQVRVGWRNTGNGWVRDDELVEGLPPFSAVMVESVEEVIKARYADDPDPTGARGAYGGIGCDENLSTRACSGSIRIRMG